MADQITEDTLVSLGLQPKKAKEFIEGKNKGKGKKQFELFASLYELALVQTKSIGEEKGKLIFKAAQKLTDDIPLEGKELFIKFLFAAPEQSIVHPVKCDAAIAWISKAKPPYEESAFKAVTGVGVPTPTEAQVGEVVAKLLKSNENEILTKMYPIEGQMLGQAKKSHELIYADITHVSAAVQAGFLSILGPRTPANTKSTKEKSTGKGKGKGKDKKR